MLVTGIGGNVGQGVLRVLRSLSYPLRLIGTNTISLSGGNHLCDAVHQVPWAWDDDYVPALRAVCEDEHVALVIPTTDHETVPLAAAPGLPSVAVSSAATCETFLDKHTTAERLAAAGIPFARTVVASGYHGEFEHTVVKPRKGRGSRDVHVDPPNPEAFGRDFVVQERHGGVELTTAFYVNRQGGVHGFIVFERTLGHGATMTCRVVHDHDAAVKAIIDALCAAFDIRGSCNLQAIAGADGALTPFEVNCRVSGTNSIRHSLGFRDVQNTVEEYLLGMPPTPPSINDGHAVRLLMDVIYGGAPADGQEPPTRATPHVLF